MTNYNEWCKELGVATLYDYTNNQNIEFIKRLTDAKHQAWLMEREKQLKEEYERNRRRFVQKIGV
jgi:hypothetical protein